MIRITDINGASHYLAAENIARVTEAGASGQWHGIRSIVRTFDGAVIECQQDASEVASKVAAAAQSSTKESGHDPK